MSDQSEVTISELISMGTDAETILNRMHSTSLSKLKTKILGLSGSLGPGVFDELKEELNNLRNLIDNAIVESTILEPFPFAERLTTD